MKLNEYQTQANAFCEKTDTSIVCVYTGHRARFDNNHVTAVFSVTIKRKCKSYTFDYSDSISNSWLNYSIKNGFTKKTKGLAHNVDIKKFFDIIESTGIVNGHEKTNTQPNKYDILACLTKSDPISFENFCSEYGYDTDSRKAEKVYHSVKEEYENVAMLFGDVMEELSEIQ